MMIQLGRSQEGRQVMNLGESRRMEDSDMAFRFIVSATTVEELAADPDTKDSVSVVFRYRTYLWTHWRSAYICIQQGKVTRLLYCY